MKKSILLAVISTIVSILSFLFIVIYDKFLFEYLPLEIYLVSLYLGFAGAIISIITWVVIFFSFLYRKVKKSFPNKFLIFGIINVILGMGIALWSIYDICTDKGFFAGLTGTLLLIFIVPIFVVLLILDVIIYFVQKKKAGKKDEI